MTSLEIVGKIVEKLNTLLTIRVWKLVPDDWGGYSLDVDLNIQTAPLVEIVEAGQSERIKTLAKENIVWRLQLAFASGRTSKWLWENRSEEELRLTKEAGCWFDDSLREISLEEWLVRIQ